MNKLRQELSAWLFKQPYDGIVWLAWIYVVFACLYAGGGPFDGDLVWFDDRVRLVQIFNWLNGQDWYDRTINRVNAPEGFHTIWSRLVDLPVAGLIAAFQSALGQMHAAMVAATIVPLTAVLLLFFAASFFAAPLVGQAKAKLVTLFVVFGSCINTEAFTSAGFQAGMVGHHSWYVLLTLMLWGSLGRLVKASDTRCVLIAGLSIGGLLTVGIEGFPLIAGSFILVAFIGWLQNCRRLLRDAFHAALIGTAFGFLTLPFNQPLPKLLVISFAEPSILGPILLTFGTLFLACQYLIMKFLEDKKIISLCLILGCGAIIAIILLYLFPQMLDGGAAALSPEERQLATDEHQEAMTIWRLARNNLDYVRMVIPPLTGLVFALCQLSKTKKNDRASLLFYLGLLIFSFGMASVYSRFFHYLSLSTSPWLLHLWLTASQKFKRDEFRAIKSFSFYFLVGPLWLWLVPAANFNQAFGTSVLLYPAKIQTEPEHCDTKSFTNYLSLRYGGDKTIIVPMYKSDRFLLHTKLKIFFLANFPSGNKFIDNKMFYETGSVDEAHHIVDAHGIDLVAVCTKAYLVSARSTLTNQLLKGHMSFGQMLVTGNIPPWLNPISIPAVTPWLLFEVDKGKRATYR